MTNNNGHAEAAVKVNVIGLDTEARRNMCPETVGHYLNCHFEIHKNDFYCNYEIYMVDKYATTKVGSYEDLTSALMHLNNHVVRMDAELAF